MRIKFNNRFTFVQIILLILLFLASVNVFEKYFYFTFASFFVFLLTCNWKIKIDKPLMILVAFSFLFIFFDANSQKSFMIAFKHFAYPFCYIIGLNFLNEKDISDIKSDETQKKTSFAIKTIAIGAFLHYLLNFAINIDSMMRNNVDVWSGRVLNATGQAALSVMAVPVFITTLVSSRSKLWKIISLLGMIVVFLYNFVLAGRSLIIITVVVLVVAFFFYILNNATKHKVKKMLITLVSFSMGSFVYINDVYGIRSYIMGTNLSLRMQYMSFFEDTRLIRKLQYIYQMISYPFGGGKLNDAVGGHAHDLLLDVYSDAGIFAFIALAIFMIVSIINIYYFVFKSSANNDLKVLVLCMYVSLLLEFSIEPIIAGMPWMFCAYCFYCGLLKNYCKR